MGYPPPVHAVFSTKAGRVTPTAARRCAAILGVLVLCWPVAGIAAPVGGTPPPAGAPGAADTATPLAAAAETPPEPSAGPVPGSSDMAEVKRIYAAGKVKYETKNYSGAIEDWTAALGMLASTPENQEIRNDLVYNIATAQEKAFDLDKDIVHLRTARALLVDFLEAYKTMYRPDEQTVAEFKRVNERVALLDARIAEAERAVPPPVKESEKRRLDLEVKRLLQNDPVLSKQYRSGRSMVVGGSIALGVGGILLLGAASANAANSRDSAGNRPSVDQRKTNRNLAIALASVGLASAVGGAVLLGLGIPKRRKAREAAVQRVVFAPTYGPGLGGGRFVGIGALARF